MAKVPQFSSQSRQPGDHDTDAAQLATAVHIFIRFLFGAVRFRGRDAGGYVGRFAGMKNQL
jgi:hypothetical protein